MSLFAKALITSAVLFPLQSFAKCSWELIPNSTKLTWTGYKTPKKVGVSGGFKTIRVSGTKKASDMMGAMTGLSYEIDLTSTSSGDKVRDVRISKVLFMGTEVIKGKFIKKEKDSLIFSATVNNVTKEIKLAPKVNGEELKAVGSFDLLDFGINKNVAEFAKACFQKHEGKTWTDVQANLSLKFKKTCS